MNKKTIIVLMVLMLCIGVVKGAKLDIAVQEKVNTTAEIVQVYPNGTASLKYSTNVTGYINITNNGNDNIYDAWISIKLQNNSSDLVLYHNGSSSIVKIYPKTAHQSQTKLKTTLKLVMLRTSFTYPSSNRMNTSCCSTT